MPLAARTTTESTPTKLLSASVGVEQGAWLSLPPSLGVAAQASPPGDDLVRDAFRDIDPAELKPRTNAAEWRPALALTPSVLAVRSRQWAPWGFANRP